MAQAIPAYTMSCFLMPKSLCQDIEIMFNKYWWHTNSTESKGLNWLSWEGMAIPKVKRDLGFRNLYGFNIALLGNNVGIL